MNGSKEGGSEGLMKGGLASVQVKGVMASVVMKGGLASLSR